MFKDKHLKSNDRDTIYLFSFIIAVTALIFILFYSKFSKGKTLPSKSCVFITKQSIARTVSDPLKKNTLDVETELLNNCNKDISIIEMSLTNLQATNETPILTSTQSAHLSNTKKVQSFKTQITANELPDDITNYRFEITKAE